jgi:hypothetical protein
VATHSDEAAVQKPLALADCVQGVEEIQSLLHPPPRRGREELVLREREQTGGLPVGTPEQPGDTGCEVPQEERAPEAGVAGVDHATTRCQESSR